MTVYLYLYQLYDDNICFNNLLKEEVFYQGSLTHDIVLSANGSKTLNLKIFTGEEIHTTLMVVDNHSHIAYMAPISKAYYLNKF
jgi:hypothetical protein